VKKNISRFFDKLYKHLANIGGKNEIKKYLSDRPCNNLNFIGISFKAPLSKL